MGHVSLVTICKNSAKTIEKTIVSVVEQMQPGDQYIVVDGLSEDGTKKIIEKHKDDIDLFISEKDEGISDAFNKGIRFAEGEIVGLINSDDTLLPGAIETVRNFFNAHPDVDVVHANILLKGGDKVLKIIKPPSHWWLPWRLVLFNHPATFVRRNIYERLGGFDLNYEIAMDVEIFLRWRKEEVNIRYLDQELVCMQAGGLSGRRAKDGCRECLRALSGYGYSSWAASIQYRARLSLIFLLSIKSKLIFF